MNIIIIFYIFQTVENDNTIILVQVKK